MSKDTEIPQELDDMLYEEYCKYDCTYQKLIDVVDRFNEGRTQYLCPHDVVDIYCKENN